MLPRTILCYRCKLDEGCIFFIGAETNRVVPGNSTDGTRAREQMEKVKRKHNCSDEWHHKIDLCGIQVTQMMFISIFSRRFLSFPFPASHKNQNKRGLNVREINIIHSGRVFYSPPTRSIFKWKIPLFDN